MNHHNSEHSCRICGNKDDHEWYRAREMMYGLRDEFWYFQCNHCNCLQIKEIPEDMSKYYPAKYYIFGTFNPYKFKGIRGAFKKYKIKSSIFRETPLQQLIKTLFLENKYLFLKELDISRESKVLDVGSGNGSRFLYPLLEAGVKNVLGCDPYLTRPLKYDNGLEILKTDIFGIKGKWDLITFHHSYEHIGNPIETMQRVSELLTADGKCIVRIPTVSSFAWQHFKTDWYQLDAPRHFFLHSVKSMQIIASKTGLEMYKVFYDSTYRQFTDSEKYRKDLPLSAPRPKGFRHFINWNITKMRYKIRTKQLNQLQQGDQAAFFFRKAR